MVSQKQFGNTHRLSGSIEPLVFPAQYWHLSLIIQVLLMVLAVVLASTVAVAALIDLKTRHLFNIQTVYEHNSKVSIL